MASNNSTASRALLVCKGPTRCSSTFGKRARNSGHFVLASCTRFSPKHDWPLSRTGRMRSGPWPLVTAIRRVSFAGAIAAFRAASMRARTALRFSAGLADMVTSWEVTKMPSAVERAKLARAALALNAGSPLPSLILMTDEKRMCDPVAAARLLPKGAAIILRHTMAETRRVLAQALSRIAHERGLLLLIAGDAPLAARIGAAGLHLPETRASEAKHWKCV